MSVNSSNDGKSPQLHVNNKGSLLLPPGPIEDKNEDDTLLLRSNSFKKNKAYRRTRKISFKKVDRQVSQSVTPAMIALL